MRMPQRGSMRASGKGHSLPREILRRSLSSTRLDRLRSDQLPRGQRQFLRAHTQGNGDLLDTLTGVLLDVSEKRRRRPLQLLRRPLLSSPSPSRASGRCPERARRPTMGCCCCRSPSHRVRDGFERRLPDQFGQIIDEGLDGVAELCVGGVGHGRDAIRFVVVGVEHGDRGCMLPISFAALLQCAPSATSSPAPRAAPWGRNAARSWSCRKLRFHLRASLASSR